MNTKTISEIAQHGKKARGKKELIRHLEGGKLTIRQAVLARCYDCTGFFADGKVDCKMPICPLHPFMVYNANRIKKSITRNISEDQKTKMQTARRQ